MPVLETLALRGFGILSSSDAIAFEPIATARPSGVSTVNFTVPGNYKQLKVFAYTQTSSLFSGVKMYFNSDTTNANYYTALMDAYASSSFRTWSSAEPSPIWAAGGSNTQPGVHIIDIYDYSSSSKTTTFKTLTAAENAGGSDGYTTYGQGFWKNTAVVTSITFQFGGTFNSGTYFELYGIRG